jgi:hypothetical protein
MTLTVGGTARTHSGTRVTAEVDWTDKDGNLICSFKTNDLKVVQMWDWWRQAMCVKYRHNGKLSHSFRAGRVNIVSIYDSIRIAIKEVRHGTGRKPNC